LTCDSDTGDDPVKGGPKGRERIAPRVSAGFGTHMEMRPERPAHFVR